MSASASLCSTLYPYIYKRTLNTSTYLSLAGMSSSRSLSLSFFNSHRRCIVLLAMSISIYPPPTILSINEKGVSPSSIFLVLSAMKPNRLKKTNSSTSTVSFQAPPDDPSVPATALQTPPRKIALLISLHVSAWQEGREVKVLLRILLQTRLHSTHGNLKGRLVSFMRGALLGEFA